MVPLGREGGERTGKRQPKKRGKKQKARWVKGEHQRVKPRKLRVAEKGSIIITTIRDERQLYEASHWMGTIQLRPDIYADLGQKSYDGGSSE